MSAGQVRTKHDGHQVDPMPAVKATAKCHISTASRWLQRDQIIRRMVRYQATAQFDAARNAIPPLIESRGFGKGHESSRVSDAYRLTDAGWELAGGKPLWL